MVDVEEHVGESVRLEVRPIPGMPDDIVAVARRYWELTGFDENGVPVWAVALGALRGEGFGQPHVVAAAGAIATVPGTCRQCGGEVRISSRTTYAQVAQKGHLPCCMNCTGGGVLEQAAKLTPDNAAQKQAAARRRQQDIARQTLRRTAEKAWVSRQREVLAEQYPLRWAAGPAPEVGVRVGVGVLALLRHAPSAAPITPVAEWRKPWWPGTPRQAADLIGDIRGTGVLRTHPRTELDSVTWTRTFDEVVEDGLEEVPEPELDDRYYPLKMRFYAPFGGTELAQAASATAEQLEHTLSPECQPVAGQEALLGLAVELIAAEVVRYLEFELDRHNLPVVPDNHRDRMVSIATNGGEQLSLGELGNLAWRSVQQAAAKAQELRRARAENMSTFALNSFEGFVQRAVDGTAPVRKPFTTFFDHPLTAVTRTLFFTVLEADPFTASVPELRAQFPEPAATPPECDGQDSGEDSGIDGDIDGEDREGEPEPGAVRQWRCDVCHGPVGLDGEVTWRMDDQDAFRDWLIVHNPGCGPSDPDYFLGRPLADLAGPDGLTELLGWLSHGPAGGHGDGMRVGDLDGFVDLVRRLHTPYYEQARPGLGSTELGGLLLDEDVPYRQDRLRPLAALVRLRH